MSPLSRQLIGRKPEGGGNGGSDPEGPETNGANDAAHGFQGTAGGHRQNRTQYKHQSLRSRGATTSIASSGMLHRLLLLPFLFPLVWRAAASPGFLPGGFQDAANIFREFSELMAKTQEETDKDFGDLENPVDFNQLPANYHNEEQDEHQVGNDTIYSHSKIDKVTDNETGDMLFSQKTVASFKKGYYGDDKPDKDSQQSEMQGRETDVSQSSSGLEFPFQGIRRIFRPRLAFLFMHFPARTTRAAYANPSWLEGPRFPSWSYQAEERPQPDMASFPEQSEDMQPIRLHHRRRHHRHHRRQPRIIYVVKKM